MSSRDVLKELVEFSGLAAYVASRKAGWSRDHLGHIISGERQLRLCHLPVLREVLGGEDRQWRALLLALVQEEAGDQMAKLIR